MKTLITKVLDKYLNIYSDEEKRQEVFHEFLEKCDDGGVTDWNNFDGHVVASAFVMAKKEKLFAVIFHDGLKMYVYPGGHIDETDENPLYAAKREVLEETGIDNVQVFDVCDDILVPFDIDTHRIAYNEVLDLPEHYHFDFRYFFVVDEVKDLVIDSEESSDYKWISFDELASNPHYSHCIDKIKDIMERC